MVAAEALQGVTIGKLDEMTTINVGTIHGGEANNIVAPLCVVTGEVRSETMDAVATHLDRIETAFATACERHGASLEFIRTKDFAPFDLDPDSLLVRTLEEAIHRAGAAVDPLRYSGGSDANVLNERGYAAVNIGIGAQKPHADDEFILEEDLVTAWRIAQNLMIMHNEQGQSNQFLRDNPVSGQRRHGYPLPGDVPEVHRLPDAARSAGPADRFTSQNSRSGCLKSLHHPGVVPGTHHWQPRREKKQPDARLHCAARWPEVALTDRSHQILPGGCAWYREPGTAPLSTD